MAPRLCVEVVTTGYPWKNYVSAPEKYAAAGVGELWVFDPKLAGPKVHGGPHRIQVWRLSADDAFERVYGGDGPAWSEAIGAWLFAVRRRRRAPPHRRRRSRHVVVNDAG